MCNPHEKAVIPLSINKKEIDINSYSNEKVVFPKDIVSETKNKRPYHILFQICRNQDLRRQTLLANRHRKSKY